MAYVLLGLWILLLSFWLFILLVTGKYWRMMLHSLPTFKKHHGVMPVQRNVFPLFHLFAFFEAFLSDTSIWSEAHALRRHSESHAWNRCLWLRMKKPKGERWKKAVTEAVKRIVWDVLLAFTLPSFLSPSLFLKSLPSAERQPANKDMTVCCVKEIWFVNLQGKINEVLHGWKAVFQREREL